jgi:hypothetical protein
MGPVKNVMLLCKELLLLSYVAYLLTQALRPSSSCIPCLKISRASLHVGG